MNKKNYKFLRNKKKKIKQNWNLKTNAKKKKKKHKKSILIKEVDILPAKIYITLMNLEGWYYSLCFFNKISFFLILNRSWSSKFINITQLKLYVIEKLKKKVTFNIVFNPNLMISWLLILIFLFLRSLFQLFSPNLVKVSYYSLYKISTWDKPLIIFVNEP